MRGRSKYGNLGAPILSEDHELPSAEWFTQFLDHFNPTDARVWQQVIQGYIKYFLIFIL